MKEKLLQLIQPLKEKYPKVLQKLIGLFFVVLFLSILWKCLFVTTSTQGFISSQIIGLRSPIAGTINMSNMEPGVVLKKGTEVFQVNGSPDAFMNVTDFKSQGVTVSMPFDGAIWSVLACNGELVGQGEEIIQVVSPGKIGVDAFFQEKYSRDLKIGRSVTVKLLDGSKSWKGKIKYVRAGIDRINPYLISTFYKYDINAPPLQTYRLVDAEIELEWDDYFSPKELYGLGRNVEVVLN